MPGEGNEQPVKKAKIHSLRKFDDKIAVHRQRQEETDEQFKEAMRNIGQLKDPMSLSQLYANLPMLHSESIELPSPQNSNLSLRSPPTNHIQRPGRLEWEDIRKDRDEIMQRKYHPTKRGRRRSTGHASNDIRNSPSPYPVIYHEQITATHPPPFAEVGMFPSLISRVKSDSDLRNSLETLNTESPLVAPTNILEVGGMPTPESSHLHLPQHVPNYWNAVKHRQTLNGPGPARKPLSGLRKRSHNSSEQGGGIFLPSASAHQSYINPKVTSLPDLTDINFHSGLDNPLDLDELSNVTTSYTPNDHILNTKNIPPQQHQPVARPFPAQDAPPFQQQQPHNRILNQATQFGYFDDAYLHLQSEPYFNSDGKKMFNSSLSIPESHPLPYAFPSNPPTNAINYPQQRPGNIHNHNRMNMLPVTYDMGLPPCPVEDLTPSVISEPTMDLFSRESMNERPSSVRSMPSNPYTRDFSQSQQFRGLDLHSTIAGPPGGYYGYDQMQLGNYPGAGLMVNPNLHKSDPLLQSIVPEGNMMPELPPPMGFPGGILDYEEAPIDPGLCIPDELQYGPLRKGHSYDFKSAFFGGNKTPVPGSYTNLSKFSSFPEMMSDGGLNPRDPRSHTQPFHIDNSDSEIDRLLEQDSASHFNSNPIPEEAQRFFHMYERDPNFYAQTDTFGEPFFMK